MNYNNGYYLFIFSWKFGSYDSQKLTKCRMATLYAGFPGRFCFFSP